MKPGAEDITELDVRKQLDYREYLEVTYIHFHDSFNRAKVLLLATGSASVFTMLRLLAHVQQYRHFLCFAHRLAAYLALVGSCDSSQPNAFVFPQCKVVDHPKDGSTIFVWCSTGRGTLNESSRKRMILMYLLVHGLLARVR